MAYQSIDELQTLLSQEVFGDRQDSKKAAGRALGTFIETIAYYLLRQWGFNDSVAIERPLAEYRRNDITHNVEFTLHPIQTTSPVFELPEGVSFTARKIATLSHLPNTFELTSNKLVNKGIVQNACVIGTTEKTFAVACSDFFSTKATAIHVNILDKHAYAMIECKRVGKEGDAKGPQTIEKAKQGAYVAKATSSLQKIRNDKGELNGVYYANGQIHTDPYDQLLNEIIDSGEPQRLCDFYSFYWRSEQPWQLVYVW